MRSARPLLFAAAFVLLKVGAGAAGDLRFSAVLTAPDRTAIGLTKLTSDQVAVIDALVRRDTAVRSSTSNTEATSSIPDEKAKPVPATFSQRLTEGERTTAGLATLTALELAQLDAMIERHQNAKLARTLLAPPVFITRSRGDPTEAKKEREIHGSFSLSFGWGSGGYSERTGSMMLSLEDPAKRYSVTIGYSETHVKGGHGVYRDPFYHDPLYRDPLYRDPFYDRHRDLSVGVTAP